MNRPIQNNTPRSEFIRESRGTPRRSENARTPGAGASAFQQVFGGTQAAANAPAKESAAPATSSASPLPTAGANLPGLFAPAAFEAHMNQWWMGLMQRQNETRMQAYENAMNGWRNVNTRNRELGIPEIPPPPPPELVPVEPKEPGWWFQIHA